MSTDKEITAAALRAVCTGNTKFGYDLQNVSLCAPIHVRYGKIGYVYVIKPFLLSGPFQIRGQSGAFAIQREHRTRYGSMRRSWGHQTRNRTSAAFPEGRTHAGVGLQRITDRDSTCEQRWRETRHCKSPVCAPWIPNPTSILESNGRHVPWRGR